MQVWQAYLAQDWQSYVLPAVGATIIAFSRRLSAAYQWLAVGKSVGTLDLGGIALQQLLLRLGALVESAARGPLSDSAAAEIVLTVKSVAAAYSSSSDWLKRAGVAPDPATLAAVTNYVLDCMKLVGVRSDGWRELKPLLDSLGKVK